MLSFTLLFYLILTTVVWGLWYLYSLLSGVDTVPQKHNGWLGATELGRSGAWRHSAEASGHATLHNCHGKGPGDSPVAWLPALRPSEADSALAP